MADLAVSENAGGQLSDYIAKVLREALAAHETSMEKESADQETDEIRARLKRLGYL